MKYFREEASGKIYAYEDDGSQDSLISGDMVPLSNEEVIAHTSPSAITRDQIEALRLLAYADPINGSDRYFSEASRLTAIGASQQEIDAAKKAGIDRCREIKEQYPWPN